jgi:homocitrate synthase
MSDVSSMLKLGWNAVKNRVQQLGLDMNDEQIKEVTAQIKRLADVRTQSIEDVDLLLKQYHRKESIDEGVSSREEEDAILGGEQ